MTGREFIECAFCDEWTYNEPTEITQEQAAAIIATWAEEGFKVPPTVTPKLFVLVWNSMVKTHCQH